MTPLRDHFAVLELLPTASPVDVKKAYRRLARKYHPDICGEDPYAKTQFEAIKEAYDVLTNPYRKEAYLQERWLAQSMGITTTEKLLTPESFLHQLILTERRVHRMDSNRSEYSQVVNDLMNLYNSDTREKLKTFHEKQTFQEILICSVQIAEKIPYPHVSPFIDKISEWDEENIFKESLKILHKKSRIDALLQQWLPWIAAFLALAICACIFLLAK